MNIRNRIIISVILILLVFVYGTVGYYFLTGSDWLNCLYMTVITLSTVGYGELIQGMSARPEVRIFTIILILAGVGLLLYAFSTITAFLVEGELTDIIRRNKMNRKISKLKNHFIVCGAGSTGQHVIRELIDTNREFVVIEKNEQRLGNIEDFEKILYIKGDATDDEILKKAGIEKARGLISVLSSDKDNLFVTISSRQLNPDIRIVSRGIETGVEKKLCKAGADDVVYPNQIGGMRIASEMIRPNVVSFLDYMLRDKEKAFRFEELAIKKDSGIAGKTIAESNLTEKAGIPILAIRKPGTEEYKLYPEPETELSPGTVLVVIGAKDTMKKLKGIVD